MLEANITQEKFDELSRELSDLKTARRREIAENLEYAKSLGDLSENAEYHEARAAQAQVEDRILKLDMLLKNAVISKSRLAKDVIGVGSVVRVLRQKDGKESLYTIVGSEDGNAAEGKISMVSPIAKALIGKRAGESFSVNTPTGENNYTILSIE